jgi:hypothetical protein
MPSQAITSFPVTERAKITDRYGHLVSVAGGRVAVWHGNGGNVVVSITWSTGGTAATVSLPAADARNLIEALAQVLASTTEITETEAKGTRSVKGQA